MSVKEKKNSKTELNIIQILESIGVVSIVNDNLLIFSNDIHKDVYLRYSIGNTFSFIKGASPIKIQVRKGFDVDIEVFKGKLNKIIEDETSSGCQVKNLYLGNMFLNNLLEQLNNNDRLKSLGISFVLKTNRLEWESEYHRVYINYDKEIIYVFTNNFVVIKNDVDTTLNIVVELKKYISEIKELITT